MNGVVATSFQLPACGGMFGTRGRRCPGAATTSTSSAMNAPLPLTIFWIISVSTASSWNQRPISVRSVCGVPIGV